MNGPGDSPSDEFGRTDPDVLERERRRQEREERRRAKDAPAGAADAADPAAEPRGRQPRAARPPRQRRTRTGPSPGAVLTQRAVDARRWLDQKRAARADRPGRAPRAPRAEKPPRSGHARAPRIAVAVVLILIAAAYAYAFQPFHGEGSGKVTVTIPKGAGAGQIADILAERGIVSNGTVFQFRLRLAGKSGDIQAGNYTLAGGMSYGDAIQTLTEQVGTPTSTLSITIPEGDSRRQIAEIARQAGISGDYMSASKKSKLLNPRKYGAKRASSLEGFLFPASYELKRNADATDLVELQLRAFKQNIGRVNLRYARKKNLNVFDVLTIAAMVEREVQIPKERPLVAAVIYNRLKQGIPLGIDATTRFATDNYDQPLKESELDSNSPYNTRKFKGLPPGPIGNPGFASIKAAANPARVGHLFYVVKPGTCGEHSFTKSAAEFDRLVAKYNQAREEAGGRSPDTCPGG